MMHTVPTVGHLDDEIEQVVVERVLQQLSNKLLDIMHIHNVLARLDHAKKQLGNDCGE